MYAVYVDKEKMEREKRKVQGPTIGDTPKGVQEGSQQTCLRVEVWLGLRDCDWACMSLAEPQTHYDTVVTRIETKIVS